MHFNRNPMKYLVKIALLCLSISAWTQEECAFDFHFFEENLKPSPPTFVTKGVQVPLPHLEIPFENFTFNSDDSEIFVIESGTLIDIPADAFLNAEGQIVKEEVQLFYREYNTPESILLSGLPMDYNTPEGKLPMQSAGMFEIRARTTKGEELFPNPDKLIEVNLISEHKEDNFNYYEMNDSTGEWIEKGKDEIRSDTTYNYRYAIRPFLGYPTLGLDIYRGAGRLRGHNKLQFKLNVRKPSRSQLREPGPYLYYTDYLVWKNVRWIYDGVQDRSEVEEILRKMNKATRLVAFPNMLVTKKAEKRIPDSLAVKDLRITINPEADNYLMTFYFENGEYAIPVYPYLNTSNQTLEQKRNFKYFTKYQKLLTEREKPWKRKIAVHQGALILFEKQREYIRQNTTIGLNANELTEKPNFFLVRRAVAVLGFGNCNIDRLMRMQTEEILVNATDKSGQDLSIKACYVWSENMATLLSYPDNLIRISQSDSDYSMTVLLENEQIAKVNSVDFKLARQNKKGRKIQLVLTPQNNEEVKKEDLKQIIAGL